MATCMMTSNLPLTAQQTLHGEVAAAALRPLSSASASKRLTATIRDGSVEAAASDNDSHHADDEEEYNDKERKTTHKRIVSNAGTATSTSTNNTVNGSSKRNQRKSARTSTSSSRSSSQCDGDKVASAQKAADSIVAVLGEMAVNRIHQNHHHPHLQHKQQLNQLNHHANMAIQTTTSVQSVPSYLGHDKATTTQIDAVGRNHERVISPSTSLTDASSDTDTGHDGTTSQLKQVRRRANPPTATHSHPLLSDAVCLDVSDYEQLMKHQAGQFEWILSVPAMSSHTSTNNKTESLSATLALHSRANQSDKGSRFYLGCNLIRREPQLGEKKMDGKIVTLLTTPIHPPYPDSDTDSPAHHYHILRRQQHHHHDAANQGSTTLAAIMSSAPGATSLEPHLRVSGAAPGKPSPPSIMALAQQDDGGRSQIRVASAEKYASLFPMPAAHLVAGIEDSLEALDRLEEQIEEMNEASLIEQFLSPDAAESSKARPTLSSPIRKSSRVATLGRSRSLRRHSSECRSSACDAAGVGQSSSWSRAPSSSSRTQNATEKSSSMTMHAPSSGRMTLRNRAAKTVRASMTRTLDELSDDASVAHRLHHHLTIAARLRQSESAASTTSSRSRCSPSPQSRATLARHLSRTPPTTKSQACHGTASSRLSSQSPGKVSSRETTPQALAKATHRRRSNRASPSEAGSIIISVARETVASRARRLAASSISATTMSGARSSCDGSETALRASVSSRLKVPLSTAAAAPTRPVTRLSIRRRAPAAIPTSTKVVLTVDEGDDTDSHDAVTTTTATTLTHRPQQQTARGRDIYARESSYVAERDKERREREAAARKAHQDAAARSRELSRQWAEKQAQLRFGGGKTSVRNG